MPNSIMFDVDDPRSAKIAEVMSNKAAKRILGLLSEGEKSASDISNELAMPLNTVSYNLKNLVEAGLVDKSKRMFWSSRGKRMEIYKLANKKIIISPKSFIGKAAPLAVLAVVAVAVLMFALIPQFAQRGEQTVSIGDGVNKFSSLEELTSFIGENSDAGVGTYYPARGGADDFINRAAEAVPNAAIASGGDVATEFSKTNIQIEGVDEPDVIKNDGKYIYVANGKTVIIVEAFPAEEMKIVAEMEFEDYVSNLLVSEDKLMAFMNKYNYRGGLCDRAQVTTEGALMAAQPCGGYGTEETIVAVYDIDDRTKPKLEHTFSVSGSYTGARMIDNYIYLITNKYVDLNSFEMPYTILDGTENKAMATDVYYFNDYDNRYIFTTVASLNIKNSETQSKVFLTGYSSALFVSNDNIYLTYMKTVSQKKYFEKFVDEVALVVLPNEEADKVREIVDSDARQNVKAREVNEIIEDYVAEIEGEELVSFFSDFTKMSAAFEKRMEKERDATIVQKISIDDGEIQYEEEGEVPGRVLNQFSMDEHDGYFRIATTTGQAWRADSENNLYVLDDDLEIVGSVEELAKGEQIYSARFIGDRAYMVTFRQVDPLFVIDLSNAENPKVLGYLKVTGYSSYLHPYDEDHLIGVGMDADAEGRTRGVKISLFDVSDVANPVEKGRYLVREGASSYSEAIYDHKAFLFDRERKILAMPISYYGDNEYWQGAYVLNIDADNGISLKGRIEHALDEPSEYYAGRANIRRALFMDDVLYTISDIKVKANYLNDLSEIEEVKLPEPVYYPYPVYSGGEGTVSVGGVETDVAISARAADLGVKAVERIRLKVGL